MPPEMTQVHKPAPDAFSIDRLRLDDTAKGLLAVIRHFLGSFAEPETQAWQMAFATAQERWGESEGPQIAMAALAVVQAVRRVRPNPFRFANPLCLTCRAWITPEEADLMSMLQEMRRDRTDAARRHLVEVTGGRIDPVLVRTGLALARRLGGTVPLRPVLATHGGLALVH